MPFKLKLKKTRQYNVASKSLFVISVELLDGGVADCTLSVDSSGQECLDNVCQRQAINQPDFFGLRYISRSQQPRWVQLDRPLKRQLDKHASSHQLYLRVMYYIISGTSLITDEVTRYHYFLQLKNDLIEGRIICDYQQAVVLASYSRQAEYGNHDRERHTVEYLKNLLTFPKQMLDGGQIIDGSTLAETGRLEWLTENVIQHHMALHNMSQAQAEEGFITSCQQLRGYGQEMFSARDQPNQSDVTIAISLTGIRVLTETSDTPHFYRWMDITNVINHKRTFSIECHSQTESAMFTLASPEDGKYVWRMCVLQHTFYMRHQPALSTEHAPALHVTAFKIFDSMNYKTRPHRSKPRNRSGKPGGKPDVRKRKEHGLSESREELDSQTASTIGRSQPLSDAHRAHSTSCLELQHDQDRNSASRALLPQYRPAPDYETAVQQKYQQQRTEAQLRYQNHHHAALGAAPAKPLVYGSHPDIHRIHYPDVTRHTVQGVAATDDYAYGLKYMSTNYPFAVNPNVQADLNQLHYVNVYKPPPPYPSNGLASNSTPDLAVASQALNYHRGYINSHVSGSSPDLVSTRTALNRQYLGYINNHVNYARPNIMPGAHGTYNNLPSVLDPKPHIIIDPHHISDNIQKVYDERGNIMYSMPMHRMPYRPHLVLPQTQQIKMNDTQEPIYENVPLPWQNDGKITMRNRAQSLTTTDEIARLNGRNGGHPTIDNYGNAPKQTLNVPAYHPVNVDSSDGHYVNAQIIKGVRESSVPKELNVSNRSINKPDEFENITLSVDRMSLHDDKDCDETPYQSLSTHKVSNNNTISKSSDNITSISVPDVRSALDHSNMSQSTLDSAISSTVINSTYNTSADESKNISSKEKKRRRWGMFMGRAKTSDVKSATLGRDKGKVVAQPANKHRWSTGLPKFQPLPPSITKETMCQILERKMSEEALAFAFEQIPKGREAGGEVRTALLPQYAALNGYSTDHLPYEDNRVKLQPSPSNPHGYINASHVTMTVGSTQRFYIVAAVGGAAAAAPPTAEQSARVWECVWQVGARLLAAVSGPQRPHYLPQDNTTHHYGDFQVSTSSSVRTVWGACLRVGVRRGARGGAARTLWHLHYSRWPHNQTLPDDVDSFLGFLSELNSLRLACESEPLLGSNAPLAFCCSAGAGRSGTALAADLLHDILDNNQELDIPRTVSLLHQQRANLIQNVHQYRFLHQLLLHYLTHTRLI